jgi:hypothetical protein
MTVPILQLGDYLIASIQTALADTEVTELRESVVERVRRVRARGVIVDVTGLDIIDSFAAPAAMVQFELDLRPLHTAPDLGEGLALLDERTNTMRDAR